MARENLPNEDVLVDNKIFVLSEVYFENLWDSVKGLIRVLGMVCSLLESVSSNLNPGLVEDYKDPLKGFSDSLKWLLDDLNSALILEIKKGA